MALAPRAQKNILEALNRAISKYKEKEGSSSRFIRVTVPGGIDAPILGMHFSLAKSDTSYTIVLVDEKTGLPIQGDQSNTALHEYIHEYTVMMFHRVYNKSESFRNSVGKSYEKITQIISHKTGEAFYKYFM